jgi:GWxTD domain-containing protein
MNGRLLPSMFLALLFVGCASSSGSVKRDNMAHLYGKGGGLTIAARVYHPSATRSVLYFKLNTRELLYKGDGGGGPFRAVVRVNYEAYADLNAKAILDSASLLVQDRSSDPTEDKELVGSIELKRTDLTTCVLKVTAHDLNRELKGTVLLRVERGTASIRQYFLPMDPANGLPLFDDHVSLGRPVVVRSEVYAGRTLHGYHYATSNALPVPVFTTGQSSKLPAKADSMYSVSVDSTEGTFTLALEHPGIHQLRLDSAQSNGLTLFVLMDSYPYVGHGTDMLKPLRYITSMQEYDRISKSGNIRQAIERFWLDAAGDRERARDAIRIYYGRVENANRHFTSHVEGWRTDRGLVHIIFGTPNSIYRSDNGETWIYGEENNLMSLTFTFVKQNNPFSDNDLVLNRDPLLKGAWYRNVESWRNGRVYQN